MRRKGRRRERRWRREEPLHALAAAAFSNLPQGETQSERRRRWQPNHSSPLPSASTNQLLPTERAHKFSPDEDQRGKIKKRTPKPPDPPTPPPPHDAWWLQEVSNLQSLASTT